MKIETLCEITQEIRDIISESIASTSDYGELVTVRPRDITRKIDLVAENALDEALRAREISARIISEELGDRTVGRDPEILLVFDPVDGSTNATCGIPFFCTSLALSEKTRGASFNDVTMAAITEINNNTYSAVRGGGAFINGREITGRMGGVRPKPIVSIYSYGVKRIPDGVVELGREVVQRTLGSIALEICFVAEKRIDGVIDTRGHISSYDIMASQLILREAGGEITDLNGRPLNRDARATSIELIATRDDRLHSRIVKLLK